MHYEENNPRHPRHRDREEHYHHMRDMRRQHRHPEHFQDFMSRWGEPDPLIHLDHQGRYRHDETRQHAPEHYRQQHEDWHDPRHNQYERHREEPIWKQQDVYFHKSNQRVEDRWNEDPMMPHPHQRRHTRPKSWDEDWGERQHG